MDVRNEFAKTRATFAARVSGTEGAQVAADDYQTEKGLEARLEALQVQAKHEKQQGALEEGALRNVARRATLKATGETLKKALNEADEELKRASEEVDQAQRAANPAGGSGWHPAPSYGALAVFLGVDLWLLQEALVSYNYSAVTTWSMALTLLTLIFVLGILFGEALRKKPKLWEYAAQFSAGIAVPIIAALTNMREQGMEVMRQGMESAPLLSAPVRNIIMLAITGSAFLLPALIKAKVMPTKGLVPTILARFRLSKTGRQLIRVNQQLLQAESEHHVLNSRSQRAASQARRSLDTVQTRTHYAMAAFIRELNRLLRKKGEPTIEIDLPILPGGETLSDSRRKGEADGGEMASSSGD